MGAPSDPLEVEPRFLPLLGDRRAEGGGLTTCRGPNRKCSSSGEEGLAMLPRSRACGARLALVGGQVRFAPPPPPRPRAGRILTSRLKAYLIF